MTSLKEKLKNLPNKPGVYLFKDRSGSIIYVGKAKSLRKRVASYFTKTQDIKASILLERLKDIDYILAGSEMDALLLEDELIKKYRPRYNIALRDDKTYPYLKLTINEKWPRLFLARKKEKDKALYFGRFQGSMVREVIRLVKKLFPIRWCKESPLRSRQQPCLYYRIGSCAGPCVNKIAREDYMKLVEGIVSLLEGKMDIALAKLEQEMKRASANQEFERAAILRDRIRILQKMIEGKELLSAPAPRLLTEVNELKTALKLKKPPMRIECFDVSNIQGSNIVASMVSFYGGVPLRNDYRKFKIRSVEKKPNDTAAIFEVVKRRYTKTLMKRMPLPDLVMVDGGVAQVNSALKALNGSAAAGLPLIGLAKREETICLPGSKTLSLPRNSSALKLLQRIRDEAHRFAVAYHRQKRQKAAFF
ncbi:MAG: excinuclease ABC subunit UvrC [Candidatus Margulisbacteria bacterium]|nr:excinuclease ABC subunit UvrC [Candidatus Margulisiibacteriota bacterium]